MIKPAYSFSFLLSINIFEWQNVLYFLDAPRILRGFKTPGDAFRLPYSIAFDVPRLWYMVFSKKPFL